MDVSATGDGMGCPICGETFRNVFKLRSHIMLHEEQRVYKCDVCGKIFSKSSNLSSHIRTHTGEKPFQCKICLKFFPRMNNLRAHIVKLHKIDRAEADLYILNEGGTPEKPEPEPRITNKDLALDIDVDKLAQVGETESYTVHQTDSTTLIKDTKQENDGGVDTPGKRSIYSCKTCKKVMFHRSNMIDHIRSHTGVKLYRCGLCQKGLSRKQNVVHHLRYVHYIENDKVDQMIIKEKIYEDPEDTFPEVGEIVAADIKQDDDDDSKFGEIEEIPSVSSVISSVIGSVLPNKPDVSNTDNNIDLDSICSSLFENDQNNETESETKPAEMETEELSYMVLFPNDPDSQVYQCKFCDFQCKEETEMTEEHAQTHTDSESYQCAICCSYFSYQSELRDHLSTAHRLKGHELDEVMEVTGSRVPVISSSSITDENQSNEPITSQSTKDYGLYEPSPSKVNANDRNINNGEESTDCLNDSNNMSFDSFNSNQSQDASLKKNKKKTGRPKKSLYDGLQSADTEAGVKSANKNSSGFLTPKSSISEKNSDLKDDTSSSMQLNMESPVFGINSVKEWIASNESTTQKQLAKAELDEMIASLMDTDNLRCRKCLKKCSNKSNLKQHVRFVHLAVKEFICVVCRKKFNTKYNLKVHWRQHSTLGDRMNEFRCKRCGKYFCSQTFLDSHIVKKHGDFDAL